LKGAARSVVFWLTYHLDRRDDSHEIYPSTDWLCWLTGFDKKTVLDAINALEAAGYIEVEREHRKNHRYTMLDLEKFDMKPIREAFLQQREERLERKRLGWKNSTQARKVNNAAATLGGKNSTHWVEKLHPLGGKTPPSWVGKLHSIHLYR